MSCRDGCGAVSTRQAHCGACHRTFSRVSNFDRHRVGGECVEPESVGLVLTNGLFRQLPPAVALRNWQSGTSGGGSDA